MRRMVKKTTFIVRNDFFLPSFFGEFGAKTLDLVVEALEGAVGQTALTEKTAAVGSTGCRLRPRSVHVLQLCASPRLLWLLWLGNAS